MSTFNEHYTNEDCHNIRKRKTPTLVRWWVELNSWKWPREIANPEPRGQGAPPQNPRRKAIMNAIATTVGERHITEIANKSGM